MSTFQWIESIGTLVTVLAALGALGYFRALNILVQAQLHPNGGGSLMDLVRLIPALRDAVGDLRERMISNHEQGQDGMRQLHAEDADIMALLNPLIEMADGLKVSLPEAFKVQEGLVRDTALLKGDMALLKEDVALLKRKVFEDSD